MEHERLARTHYEKIFPHFVAHDKERMFLDWINAEAVIRRYTGGTGYEKVPHVILLPFDNTESKPGTPDNGHDVFISWINEEALNRVNAPLALTDDAPKPGTPVCELVKDIATRLKEIEAERLRAAQAATLPEEKK